MAGAAEVTVKIGVETKASGAKDGEDEIYHEGHEGLED